MPGTLSTLDPPRRSRERYPHLFLVLEGARPMASGARWALVGIDHAVIGRGEQRAAERRDVDSGRVLAVTVPDARMSVLHARLVNLAGGWAIEDAGSKNGTRVNGEPTRRRPLVDGDTIEVGETLLLFRELAGAATVDQDGGDLGSRIPGLFTQVPALAAEFDRLSRVASSDVSVLVHGETGVGKELIARAVHAGSRRAGRFAAVNCGAIPAGLVESELFGARKGAFSGAVDDRPGYMRSADGGTLFLDEIADLPLAAQAALLRVLQEREVIPLGDTRPVPIDVRVVAATNQDLGALVACGKFRSDLLARLAGFTFELPPLRARREDLGLLVASLLDRLAPGRPIRFAPEVLRAMVQHTWPANVRELESAVAAALALADDRIELEHLPPAVRVARAPTPPAALSAEDESLRTAIAALLEKHGGNLSAIAREMGKDRTQVRRWLKRFGLERAGGEEPR